MFYIGWSNLKHFSLVGIRPLCLCRWIGSGIWLCLFLYDLMAETGFSIWLGLGESCAWFWPLLMMATPLGVVPFVEGMTLKIPFRWTPPRRLNLLSWCSPSGELLSRYLESPLISPMSRASRDFSLAAYTRYCM
jgi:hypothetical protein